VMRLRFSWAAAFTLLLVSNVHADTLDSITVEAQRSRKDLERRIDTFVSAIIVKHNDWPYARWHLPVCPLVAGLPKAQGEFILERVSEIARAATVKLAPEKCTGNFLVVFTGQPYELITQWRRRNPGMFDVSYGEAQFGRFLNSTRPVRVWYNAEFPDDNDTTEEILTGGINMNQFYGAGSARLPNSKLKWGAVRVINTAIVVVDTKHLKKLNLGQLADYIGVVGLAEINLDRNSGDAPTVLRLFSSDSSAAGTGLTDWDRAFLKSVYSTRQEDVLQLSEMKTEMFKTITAPSAGSSDGR
jgi:hypothetical protein